MAAEALQTLDGAFDTPIDFIRPLGAADLLPAVSMLPPTAKPLVQAVLTQISPTMEIMYKIEGSCDDFNAITIDCGRFQVTGTTTFGPATVFALMIPMFYRTEACRTENGEGKRKTRTFRIEWYLTANVSIPVVGSYTYTTSAFKTYEQTVRAPCCKNKGGGWF